MGAYDFKFDLPPDETYAPNPERVRALQALLPAQPFTFAPDVTHRPAWDRWRDTAIGTRALQSARDLLAKPAPDYTDAIVLDSIERKDMTRINQALGGTRHRQGAFLLAELIHDTGEFIPHIIADFERLCILRTWLHPYEDERERRNYNRQTVDVDLGVVHNAENLALTVRLLGPRLPAGFGDRVLRELQARIFGPMRQRVESGRDLYWWFAIKHNWLAVCLSGTAQAAAAILPDPADRAWWLAFVEARIREFRESFTDDGACTEGVGYWGYGFMNFIQFAELLRLGTGNVQDLLDEPKWRRIARWPDHTEIQPGVFPCFADSGLGGQPIAWVRSWLDNRIDATPPAASAPLGTDPLAAMSLHLASEPLLWMFRTRDPFHPVRREFTPGIRDWFPQALTLISRPGPATTRRFSALLLGGNNGVNHNHNDLGTFNVVLDGRMLILDPGPEVYTYRTFSEKRYDSQLLNSYGHPVPRVAGHLQEYGADRRTTLLAKEFTDVTDRIVFDLRGVYDVPGLRRLTREYIYDRRGAGSLTITDHVEFSEPSAFESALITTGQVAISGLSLRITDAAAIVVEASCDGAELELATATIDQPPHPTRVALRCRGEVRTATVRAVIRPA